MTLLDFEQPAAASQEINRWVEKQTADKIKDLIKPSDLDRDTRLVLTNAIYFKGDWTKPFHDRNTREEDFTVSAQKKVKVPLMQQTAAFGYQEEETLQVLEMPYAGRELAMVVLLPKNADGLAELEKAISTEKLAGLLARLATGDVITFLPKFKLETSFELKPTLQALGMKLPFSGADFSGINSQEELEISTVIHKAYVDVNEQGTEAAAATGVVVTRAMAVRRPEPIPVFRADHPFLFLIRDTRSGAILFLGRVEDPSR